MVKLKKKDKILVAMSGGVDSSVAAALLVAQGYDVTGAFMVNYETQIETDSDKIKTDYSCWASDYQDALRVAAKLGIPLMHLNFVKEYKKFVLDYMYKEYRKGKTPNPDVLCNKFVKFGAWLDKAKELGFDFIATGHYARLVNSPLVPIPENRGSRSLREALVGRGGLALMSAKDTNKDQTYFLHQLNQEQLKYVLFPIGGYTKPEVRKLAKKFNLPTADKEESMGICFVGEVPMKEFLLKKIKTKKGKIILSPSAVGSVDVGVENFQPTQIGEHDGLPFYTIGQRQGLSRLPLLTKEGRRGGLPSSALSVAQATVTPLNLPLVRGEGDTRSLYVVGKNFAKNELVVGYEDDPLLYKKTAEVSEVNWVGGQPPRPLRFAQQSGQAKFPLNCEVRLRHRQPLQKCVVDSPLVPILENRGSRLAVGRRSTSRGGLVIKFSKPQRAVTPGQFAVFYANGECLGGGVIN